MHRIYTPLKIRSLMGILKKHDPNQALQREEFDGCEQKLLWDRVNNLVVGFQP